MKPKKMDDSKYTIPAVCTAMEIVRLLLDGKGETTTKELAYRLGVPRTTCYRVLRSLIAKNWVRPVENGCHELSLGLLPLLHPLRHMERLANALRPLLETLAVHTHLAAKVSVRQGEYTITVAQCESPCESSAAVQLGAASHLSFGSWGAIFLSELAWEEIQKILERAPAACWACQQPEDVWRRVTESRAQGWCVDRGSFYPGCSAVSVPLRDSHQGGVRAALTIIGASRDLPPDRLAGPVKTIVETARRAEREMRKLAPPPPFLACVGTRKAGQRP